MDQSIAILLVEDSELDAALLLRNIEKAGFSVVSRRVDTIDEMRAALYDSRWDIILSDYVLPTCDAPSALEALKMTGMDIPFIVVSGVVADDVAIATMRLGAQDYIPKTDFGRLVPAIQREISEARRRRQYAVLEVRAGAIMEAAQEAIIMMDPAGLITFWNPASERILGYPAREALGQDLHRLLAPAAYHAAFKQALPRFQRTGEGEVLAGTRDLSAVRKDGTQITVSLSLSSVALNGGWYAIGIIQDVTEQRRSEEQLRVLSRGIDFSPASIVITDPHGNIVYVNRKFVEVSGYAASDVMGQNPRILKSNDKSQAEYGMLWSTISGGGTWFGEFHNRKKNGELYWETASISPVYDAHGQITHYIAVKEDITQRKQIQDALTESEERYRAIFDQSVEGIYLVDIETRKVVQANQTCSGLLGYDDGELVGRSIYDIVAGPREGIDERICALIKDRTIMQSDRTYLRKDGPPFPVRASATVVTFANRSAICTVFNDVTEQKQQVETLKESEERFRLISENVADIIILFETTGECVYASPSVSALGHDPSTLIGRSIFSLIHPEDYARYHGRDHETCDIVHDHAARHSGFDNAGDWRAMEAALSLLVSHAGYRIVAVLRDVSARQEHERQQELLLEELTGKEYRGPRSHGTAQAHAGGSRPVGENGFPRTTDSRHCTRDQQSAGVRVQRPEPLRRILWRSPYAVRTMEERDRSSPLPSPDPKPCGTFCRPRSIAPTCRSWTRIFPELMEHTRKGRLAHQTHRGAAPRVRPHLPLRFREHRHQSDDRGDHQSCLERIEVQGHRPEAVRHHSACRMQCRRDCSRYS